MERLRQLPVSNPGKKTRYRSLNWETRFGAFRWSRLSFSKLYLIAIPRSLLLLLEDRAYNQLN